VSEVKLHGVRILYAKSERPTLICVYSVEGRRVKRKVRVAKGQTIAAALLADQMALEQ
jgi:hypothetical protein